ncbi:MAG: ATP synthase F1 subunit delta [Candidatus Margulisiibacteriota bacterium]
MPEAANKYAVALATAAKENSSLDAVLGDFGQFISAIKASKDFCSMFFAPNFSVKQKTVIYKKMFKPSISPYFIKFLQLLHKNKRERCIFESYIKFESLCLEAKNTQKITVTTASALNSEQRSRMAEMLSKKTGKKILIDNTVDPGIISGAVIRIKDKIIDASMASRLKGLRKELSRC